MSWNVERRSDPRAADRILRSLPTWFGIDDAVASYVEKAAVLDSYVSRDSGGSVVGVALFERHCDQKRSLLVRAPERHRHHGDVAP